jgi:hippurate hydrolase
VNSTSEQFGVTSEVTIEEGYPSVVNHEESNDKWRAAAARLLGEENIIKAKPTPGSEDFSYFVQEVPGAMVLFYTGDSKMMHSPYFDFPDELFMYTTKMFAGIVEECFGITIFK